MRQTNMFRAVLNQQKR